MFRQGKLGTWKKYHNRRTERDGHFYDSGLESKVGWELEMRMKAGEIKEIQRQVDFPLMVNGQKVTTYRADFLVTMADDTQEVFEAKGMLLPLSKLKLRLFEVTRPEIKLHVIYK